MGEVSILSDQHDILRSWCTWDNFLSSRGLKRHGSEALCLTKSIVSPMIMSLYIYISIICICALIFALCFSVSTIIYTSNMYVWIHVWVLLLAVVPLLLIVLCIYVSFFVCRRYYSQKSSQSWYPIEVFVLVWLLPFEIFAEGTLIGAWTLS